MKNRGILYFFILTLSLASCKNKVQNWIDSYAETKCAYQEVLEKQKVDSIKILYSLNAQLNQLESELKNKEKPFSVKIEKLIQQNSNIEIDYLEKYRQITDAHSLKYGHFSTPEYENKIAQIEKQRDNLINNNNSKIQFFELKKSTNNELNVIVKKRDKLKKQITNKIIAIKYKYKDKFTQLQFELNDENSSFESLYKKSDLSEKKILNESRRELIRKYPCEKIKMPK